MRNETPQNIVPVQAHQRREAWDIGLIKKGGLNEENAMRPLPACHMDHPCKPCVEWMHEAVGENARLYSNLRSVEDQLDQSG